jgi:hypothetical protein
MSTAIETIQDALQREFLGRPAAGGFPYLAETPRRAGVTRNLWLVSPGLSELVLN